MRFSSQAMRIFVAAFFSALLTLILVGCGGSRDETVPVPVTPNPVSVTPTRGRLAIVVRWPERSRLIPAAAGSISLRLSQRGALLAERLLVRPAEGGETTALFENIPSSEVILSASAYPNVDGTGTAQATAQVSLTIAAGDTGITLPLTLESTIDRLEIAPENPSVAILQDRQFSVAARDAAGNVVLTDAGRLAWSSSNPAIVAVDASGIVRGVTTGTAQISATETESGRTAAVNVTVEPPRYRVTDLGAFDSLSLSAGLNNRGHVIFNNPAFLWSEGTLHLLHLPDGRAARSASDINDTGQIVGSAVQSHLSEGNQAFLWENGTARFLSDAPSSASAIDSAGRVVGAVNDQAVLFEDGAAKRLIEDPLPAPYTMSFAIGINNKGHIAASYRF